MNRSKLLTNIDSAEWIVFLSVIDLNRIYYFNYIIKIIENLLSISNLRKIIESEFIKLLFVIPP